MDGFKLTRGKQLRKGDEAGECDVQTVKMQACDQVLLATITSRSLCMMLRTGLCSSLKLSQCADYLNCKGVVLCQHK